MDVGRGGGASCAESKRLLLRNSPQLLPPATRSSKHTKQGTFSFVSLILPIIYVGKNSSTEKHNGWPCLGDWLRVVTTLSCSCLYSMLPWAWTKSYLILPKPSRHNSHLTSTSRPGQSLSGAQPPLSTMTSPSLPCMSQTPTSRNPLLHIPRCQQEYFPVPTKMLCRAGKFPSHQERNPLCAAPSKSPAG